MIREDRVKYYMQEIDRGKGKEVGREEGDSADSEGKEARNEKEIGARND